MTLRRTLVVVVLGVVAVAGCAASLAFGAVSIPISEILGILFGSVDSGPDYEIIQRLRLPRMVEALLVGAALGVAGACLQGALSNPLASPDVIGVTGGAGFGAMLVLLLLPAQAALVPLSALAFGLLAASFVFLIGFVGERGGGIGRVILAGIAIASLFGAATAALMAAFPDRVPAGLFFLVGGLTTTGWDTIRQVLPYFVVGFVLSVFLVRPLDRLALGDEVAASLGSRPRRIRFLAAFVAALLASAAAAVAGLLAFLGLVVPHMVRLAAGTARNTYVLPVSALGGAALLVSADTLARVIAAPVELPVGPLLVLLGVPVFLYLLRKAV